MKMINRASSQKSWDPGSSCGFILIEKMSANLRGSRLDRSLDTQFIGSEIGEPLRLSGGSTKSGFAKTYQLLRPVGRSVLGGGWMRSKGLLIGGTRAGSPYLLWSW